MQCSEEVLLELLGFLFDGSEHFLLVANLFELWKVLPEFFCNVVSQIPLSDLVDHVDLISVSLGRNCKYMVLEVDLLEWRVLRRSMRRPFALGSLRNLTASTIVSWLRPLEWNSHSHRSLDRETRRCVTRLLLTVTIACWSTTGRRPQQHVILPAVQFLGCQVWSGWLPAV